MRSATASSALIRVFFYFFCSYMDIKLCAAVEWYSMLMQDVAVLCRIHGQQEEQCNGQFSKGVCVKRLCFNIAVRY